MKLCKREIEFINEQYLDKTCLGYSVTTHVVHKYLLVFLLRKGYPSKRRAIFDVDSGLGTMCSVYIVSWVLF